jgi:hypothetical protein
MSEPSYEELKAKLEELQKQAPAANVGVTAFKVSPKGAVSLYGLGRYPVTLYYEQWMKLLERADQLRGFLEANKGALKLRTPKAESC